jgi:hypothetical protein|eukprot:CAMPEP_0174349942 /NCGR_PEP_ID=MMETSP0811_2-20130205/6846_1 /TAXON_ID=73025 ORGANISM="Eutreptiella gymnastica-like, Strain CCMP1594" /NCGR_SAMPLE_ID=MMETSP0811_2 /ASSEMBLY_ACC=CAM_ASM_000667 /LENGTH=48 /DNA_ID= /DNA_START= /DNA_END= /DNA_ORIENTATION=
MCLVWGVIAELVSSGSVHSIALRGLAFAEQKSNNTKVTAVKAWSNGTA